MWPVVSAWAWWGIAAALAGVLVVVTYYPFGWRFKRPSATAVDEHAKSLSDEEAWRIGPGAGLLAADAIEKAESMDEARNIFRAFQAHSSRRNVKEVYHAYIERLKREGLGASDEAFDVGWDEAADEH